MPTNLPRIMAFDFSTHTGWATNAPFDGEGRPVYTSNVFDLDPPKEQQKEFKRRAGRPIRPEELNGYRLNAFRDWLRTELDRRPIDALAYEEIPHYSSTAWANIAAPLMATVNAEAYRRRIYVEGVKPNSLKQWATGYGLSTKEQMVAVALRDFGWVPSRWVPVKGGGLVPNNDEADAFLVLKWAETHLRFK